MTATDEGSLEHVHAKYGHLRELKRREEEEAKQRTNLCDIYEGYYPEEES